jgi:hypothetical protein
MVTWAIGEKGYSQRRAHQPWRSASQTSLQPGPNRTITRTDSSYNQGQQGGRVITTDLTLLRKNAQSPPSSRILTCEG